MKTAKEKAEKQIEELVTKLDLSGLTPSDLTSQEGLLKQLTKRIIETAMNTEMDDHLGHGKNERSGEPKKNIRNGTSSKNIITNQGEFPISIPRDRDSTFEPKIVPKFQRRFDGFDDKIISMYGLGLTTRDIMNHLKDIYGVDVSHELISQVTDSILDEVKNWRGRPLDNFYPIVYFDALVVKAKDEGKARNKSVYIALGITKEGQKDILGLWISNTEGAKFWLSVITELKNRGVDDILIACIDGLSGFPEAINSVFPETSIQLCIVHMIRNSTKYVSYKDRKVICQDLKTIYSADTEEMALKNLDEFSKKWDSKYPMISKSWKANWENLNEFFNYPEDIRRAIYTTNAIESLNSSLRKIIKKRSLFPTDDSIFKIMYLALKNASKKWTMPIRNWGAALNQLAIHFEGRVKL